MEILTKEQFLAGKYFVSKNFYSRQLFFHDNTICEVNFRSKDIICRVTKISENGFSYTFMFLGETFKGTLHFAELLNLEIN